MATASLFDELATEQDVNRRRLLFAAYRLQKNMRGCTKCQLRTGAKQVVSWVGPIPTRVALVGEAPGYQEDRQGEPFVGPAGELLNRLLFLAGLRREDVCILNVVSCRPPGNRAPLPMEAAACSDWFNQQLTLADPELVVALGATALQKFRPGAKITVCAGTPFRALYAGQLRAVFPILHPAAALHNRDNYTRLVRDFKALGTLLANGVGNFWPGRRLYLYLNRQVLTPRGSGVLVQVFSDRVAVALSGQSKATFFYPEEITVEGESA